MSIIRFTKLLTRITASNVTELHLPYRLTYAITNRCQARCTMCNIWQKPAQNELTRDEIATLFSKANRFSWINLTGGELFQRPDIQDIIFSIIHNSPNLYLLNFPTNGIQTAEIVATVDGILQKTPLPRLIVSVSLDGAPQLHDSIRGVSGCWQHAVETFKQLRELRSSRFSVYFGHTIQTANLGTFDDTLHACRKELQEITVDDFHINLAHASGHYYDNIDSDAVPETSKAQLEIKRISSQRSKPLFEPISFIERSYHKHTEHFLQQGRAPFICQAAAASCFIDPFGTVYPCSVFNTPLGSLREYGMDLYELWNSATRIRTRTSIRANECPACWTPCEAYQTILANLLRTGKNR